MKNKNKRIAALKALGAAALFWGAGTTAGAEVLVIGSAGSGVSRLSGSDVEELYLGKAVQLPDGTRAEVVDLPGGHPVRDEFYQKVIGKDPSQIKAYWAKRIFTGKGSPPDTKPSEDAVVQWVADKPGRIGYVSPSADTESVSVLLKVN